MLYAVNTVVDNPADVIAVVAFACVIPIVFGTVVVSTPNDITRVTGLPTFTSVPTTGLC